ncbi:uncharacterized protein LOC121609133 [Chelmon rostratus]|uniref:uncharacterized protein LOC121609133 n=1 Tax=Chelmon rostratus TaxID=109905 RepID=UPI001BE69E55|nr:uncharacterized protein LOC121609133 [Chelmon rostratus]
MEAVGRSVVVELAGEVGRDLVLPVSSSNTTSPLLKMRSINVCETSAFLIMPCPAQYTHSMISAVHCCKSQKRKEQKKRTNVESGKMHISLSLLLFFIGSASAKKQGDFGIFSACITKNNSLRLDCYYAECPSSPPFICEFMTSDGSLLAKGTNEMCRLFLPDHPLLHGNKTTNYNCTLTRRNRREEKQITIDYSIRTGKQRIKPCRATTGMLLQEAPTLLWPMVIVSLWRVLVTDSQTT